MSEGPTTNPPPPQPTAEPGSRLDFDCNTLLMLSLVFAC